MSADCADDLMQRLAKLAVEIERHQTAIRLAENEREELRTQLRLSLNAPRPGGST
jgi:hypothetical protein